VTNFPRWINKISTDFWNNWLHHHKAAGGRVVLTTATIR